MTPPLWRRERPRRTPSEATKARIRAERDLAATKAETRKYRDLAESLVEIQRKNHLGLNAARMLRGEK